MYGTLQKMQHCVITITHPLLFATLCNYNYTPVTEHCGCIVVRVGLLALCTAGVMRNGIRPCG